MNDEVMDFIVIYCIITGLVIWDLLDFKFLYYKLKQAEYNQKTNQIDKIKVIIKINFSDKQL